MDPLVILEQLSSHLAGTFQEIIGLCELYKADHKEPKEFKEFKEIKEPKEKEPPKLVKQTTYLPTPASYTPDKKSKYLIDPKASEKMYGFKGGDMKGFGSAPAKFKKIQYIAPLKKKKKRRYVDPDMPKKPPGSYILYLQDRKPAILQHYPEIALTEISKIVGKQWNQLKESDKVVYNRRYMESKEKYEKQLLLYKMKHPEYEFPKPKKVVPPVLTSKFSEKPEIGNNISDSSSDIQQKYHVQNSGDSLGDV